MLAAAINLSGCLQLMIAELYSFSEIDHIAKRDHFMGGGNILARKMPFSTLHRISISGNILTKLIKYVSFG